MTGVRIRWAVLGKVAAIAVAGLAAVQVLPGLLRAPEPPPLAADVGLPRTAPGPRFQRDEMRPKRTTDRLVAPRPAEVAPRRHSGSAASTVIASTPRHRRAAPGASKPAPEPVAAAPAPPVAIPPPPAPISPPENQPAAAPEAPDDGSVEFAPH
jgi:hypothetical protein